LGGRACGVAMRDYCLASVVTVLRESYPLENWKPHLPEEELVEAKGQPAIEAFDGSIGHSKEAEAGRWNGSY
jgi:hypothetical protein